MINSKVETTLIQIIPETLILKRYYPNKINEQTITIRNNCSIPLILSLSSSDSNILILKESSIKIGIKQKKSLSFIISDKNYIKNKKNLKPKKIYIFMKNDLLEEKFEIILSYNSLDNLSLSENKNMKTKHYFSFNKNNNKKKLFSNEKREIKEESKNIKKMNFNNIMRIESNDNRFGYINSENNYNDEKANEREYLNNAVMEMRNQISYLKQMLEHSQRKIHQLQLQNKNFHFINLIKEKSISFFINRSTDREMKYKKYQNIRSKREYYGYKNRMLNKENNKLNNMIMYLEQK